jgi:hypothetical protein
MVPSPSGVNQPKSRRSLQNHTYEGFSGEAAERTLTLAKKPARNLVEAAGDGFGPFFGFDSAAGERLG